MEATDIILALVTIVVAGIGYWAKRIDDSARATWEALNAHKLYAAENYMKDSDLEKLRKELVGHFERLERLVNAALSQRRHNDAGE